MEGWIRLHRQVSEHWIWKDPVKFQWWIDMLLMANHADVKVNIGFDLYDCKRSQSILSLKSWGERWGVSKDTVRNFFVLLTKDNMIISENIQKSTRITICNYETYQSDLHAKQTQGKRLTNAEQTQPHPNKNEKNVNNEITNRNISIFDEFRKIYPGAKRGLDTEFENFNRKIKDWIIVLPLLLPAIKAEIQHHNDSKTKGAFVPEYANLSTWINQRRWETELPNYQNEEPIIRRTKASEIFENR